MTSVGPGNKSKHRQQPYIKYSLVKIEMKLIFLFAFQHESKGKTLIRAK